MKKSNYKPEKMEYKPSGYRRNIEREITMGSGSMTGPMDKEFSKSKANTNTKDISTKAKCKVEERFSISTSVKNISMV